MRISNLLLIAMLAITAVSAQTQTQIEKHYTRDHSGCILDETIKRTIFLENCTG